MRNAPLDEWQSGQKTAKKACDILVSLNDGLVVPSSSQKANLLVAFAKKGKVVYGRAFDIVKASRPINLDDLSEVEKNLKELVVFEVKSTRKKLRSDFSAHFFGLTGADVLVAQSLKRQFKFALVNTSTGGIL